MKRILPGFIFLVLASGILQAQVVLQSTMAPLPGSKLSFQEFDDPASFTFVRQGENLTWDFTGMSSHAIEPVIYVDPATTAYPTAYPTANLAVNMEEGIGYIENNASQELLLGVVGDPGSGVQPMPFYPAMPLFDFPYTYGSSMNTTSQVRVRMDGASFGIPATDSIKYHMTLTTIRNVVGWGTLNLPDGIYDGTLLEKAETIQVDSAWMKVVFLGWILAPGYPVTTYDSSYRWLTDEMLHPYAEVGFGEGGYIESVTYFKGLNVSAGAAVTDNDIFLQPNPANDYVVIGCSGQTPINKIDILASDGHLCESLDVPSGTERPMVNVRRLSAGIYVMVIHTTAGEKIVKRLVKR
ncbi:MAG TPA: hypothetical protein DCR43_08880 [Bacteroidales bacterium]|nr:MAG: hypothetical protein A2X11_04240 [Bacteroidetes bacterium GWE2_42_24]OFY25259.1 MAG: hypothetical protein A2X09_11055 [Bacteroidetes bacterium GWF2_43_11]HAQ65947.1 hypothetical protein [Bacteroidales bacterium]HBZ66963.1 hypothetical protein [Bacteroidales bacterium]